MSPPGMVGHRQGCSASAGGWPWQTQLPGPRDAHSPLPVNGIHKERGGPGMLQGGLRNFPLLEVASFLFSEDVVFPRLSLFCAAGSTSAAHAEI